MVEHQAAVSNVETRPSGGAGGIIALIVFVFVLFMGALFISGFWTPGEKYSPAMPHYQVSIRGGNAPAIELKQIAGLAGDGKLSVGVPAVD